MTITRKPKITLIGDSTIDNRLWVQPGPTRSYIRTRLGISPQSTEERIKKSHRKYFKTELSVVEHLIDEMPNYEIIDYTNDGFTTTDILQGAFRDKVFGRGMIDLFPHDEFSPLVEGKEDIQSSNYIILSVGGNNVREFLLTASQIKNAEQRKEFLKAEYDKVFSTLKEEYKEILRRIRALNSDAKIILMTQYYPSIVQKSMLVPFNIYSLLQELADALELETNPIEMIHKLMQDTYVEVSQTLDTKNLFFADITSSLNPFDEKNHVCQIEPSEKGGGIIAKILKHIINNIEANLADNEKPVCRLQLEEKGKLEWVPLNGWSPRHPHEFTDMAAYQLLEKIREKRDQYDSQSSMYAACNNVYKEGQLLLRKIKTKQDADDLRQSLTVTLNALENVKDPKSIADLENHAKKVAVGKPVFWKKFIGALMILAGGMMTGLGFAAIPVTGGLSAIGGVAGVGLAGSGIGLFAQGRQKSLSKGMAAVAHEIPRLANAK